MLSITYDDDDDYIPSGDIIARYSTSKSITPDLPIQEPNNSLNMGDEHLDTIPATESDEVIKSSVENLVPIPSEFEGMSDDTSDIDPILEEFTGELAHIAPIPPGIVEADFDPNDDTSSDDDSYEDIEYVDATPPNLELVSLEEVEDVILRDKLPAISASYSASLLVASNLNLMAYVNSSVEMPKSGKILIPCALQELNRTSALADSGASINLLPHSIYKQLGLEALTHPMGIADDVVVRVDGFTFLADFVVVNFEPDPRAPIILGRPFLRTAKALIDLYEETLTLRVGKEELVYYADKSEKNKNKHFVHAIFVIDFSKDDPFSGSTTTHSDDPSLSSSPVKTSDNSEKFADELAPLDSLPPGNDDSTLKKDLHEENFQDHSNPLFEFDDNFKSSTINPLFDEKEEDVEIKNFNEPVLLNTPLSDKVECFAPEDNNDEIDAFLAMEVSSNFEEGYFDSEGDVTFLDNLLNDDTTHNLASKVISDHEPEQNESSITFSPRIIESLPVSPIPVEDNEPVQEEIDIFLVPDDLIPPGVENDDSENEDNELPNLDHQYDPSIPRPPILAMKNDFVKPNEDLYLSETMLSLNDEDVDSFTFIIWTFLPYFTYTEESPLIFPFRSENFVFDPGIITFPFSYLEPMAFSMEVSCSKIDPPISEASRVR
ncbi:reverse transcriptase domain-containing protein [Tanacetum coccineum]